MYKINKKNSIPLKEYFQHTTRHHPPFNICNYCAYLHFYIKVLGFHTKGFFRFGDAFHFQMKRLISCVHVEKLRAL